MKNNKISDFRSHNLMKLTYWCLRLLLASVFLISGYNKLPGNKFTQLAVDNPIGYFFNSIYQLGFIGILLVLCK